MGIVSSDEERQSRPLLLDRETFQDDKKAADFVNNLHSESKHHKWPFERQWFYNINFYLGRQWVVPTEQNRKFVDKRRTDPPWRVRYVANKIKPFVRRKIAKLTRDSPVLQVSPATGDFEDIQKARLCDRLLEHLWANLRLQDTLTNEALLWLVVTGNVFLRPFWNKNRGPKVSIRRGEVGDELFQELAGLAAGSSRFADPESATGIEMALGDLDLHVVSPFSFFCHPSATRVDQSLWALESTIKDLDTLREQWGDPAFEVNAESEADMAWSEYEERLLDSTVNSISQRAPRSTFPRVIEKQLWLRPCRVVPEGRYVVVAGDQTLHNGPFPYDHGKLPFVHLKDAPVPGRLWAQSVVEDAIPAQKAHNALVSKRAENVNLHCNAKWMNPKGSGVTQAALTSAPSEVVSYVDGKKPEQVVPPPLPSAVSEQVARHEQDFNEITGQQDATRGIAPGRVDSAQGIIALQEADDTQLGPLNKHLSERYAEMGMMFLALAKQFYKEDRLLKIVGRRGAVEVRKFTGSDLAPGSGGDDGFQGEFDVRAMVGSGLPLGRAARAEFVMNLVKSGLFRQDDPKHREIIFRVIELGGPRDDIFEEGEAARAQANIENADMAAGFPHSVNIWDEDTAHIDVHLSHMRRPEFMREVATDPGLAERFWGHVAMHFQAQGVKGQWMASMQQGPGQQGPGAGAMPEPAPPQLQAPVA